LEKQHEEEMKKFAKEENDSSTTCLIFFNWCYDITEDIRTSLVSETEPETFKNLIKYAEYNEIDVQISMLGDN